MKKSNVEIAKEVYAGEWGNGVTRSQNLKKAGYDAKVIQELVNKLAKGQNIDRYDLDDKTFRTAFDECVNAISNLEEFKTLMNLM